MPSRGRRPKPNIWHSLVEFIVHVLVGSIAFFIISAFAILLDTYVSYLKENEFNPIIIKGLIGFEYALFGLDLLLAGLFLLGSTYKLVREIWQ